MFIILKNGGMMTIMKIYGINGSPRKKWNSEQMLDSFLKGVLAQEPDACIEMIQTYELNYTGCRSCFGCKLLTSKPLECVVRDDLHDLLIDMRNSDGIVLASPIYFFDLSAQLKCLLERLMYPGRAEQPLPSAFIYTMNADEEAMEKYIRHQIDTTKQFMKSNFLFEPLELFSFDTYQRDHNELYRKGHTDMEAKKIRHDQQFPKDLDRAFEAGKKFAEQVKKVREL